MFWRIKKLISGMYNSGSEEWYDNTLYRNFTEVVLYNE